MRFTRGHVALVALAAGALVLPATVPTVAGSGPRPQAIPVVAEMTTGGGASYMDVAVNRQGNLSFESPKDVGLTHFNEGYGLCKLDQAQEYTAYAYNLPLEDGGSAGLGPVTVTQPTRGAFPVTIVRRTLDGTIRLSQTWAVPDPTEKDVTVSMTVRNISASPLSDLRLMRSADGHSDYADSPDNTFFAAATTADSVFQWWDEDANGSANGLVMTALTVGRPHEAGMSDDIDLALYCGGFSGVGSGYDAEGSPQIVYFLPTIAPGAEVTVAFLYHRL